LENSSLRTTNPPIFILTSHYKASRSFVSIQWNGIRINASCQVNLSAIQTLYEVSIRRGGWFGWEKALNRGARGQRVCTPGELGGGKTKLFLGLYKEEFYKTGVVRTGQGNTGGTVPHAADPGFRGLRSPGNLGMYFGHCKAIQNVVAKENEC
jgi:hypothetical protein